MSRTDNASSVRELEWSSVSKISPFAVSRNALFQQRRPGTSGTRWGGCLLGGERKLRAGQMGVAAPEPELETLLNLVGGYPDST